MSARPIDFTYSTPTQSRGRRLAVKAAERVGGHRKLVRLYDRFAQEGGDFYERAVELMKLDVRFDAAALAAVPREGPVLFVANHPYGVVDGVTLTWLARRARPGVRVLTNSVLCQSAEAAPALLPIDFSETREAARANARSRRTAFDTLKAGGAVGIFPAGSVAASERPLGGPAVDVAWHPFAAKLARGSGATVVPIYFAGQNSRMFQLASHVSYTWRLALFFYETARRLDTRLDVGIGRPIPFAELAHLEKDDMVREMRRRTFALAADVPTRHRVTPPPFDREFAFPKRMRFT